MKFWLTWALGFAFAMYVALAIFFVSYGNPKIVSRQLRCLSNIKQQSTAMLLYESDFDDRLPRVDHWMDAGKGFFRDYDILRCPSMRVGTYGYAFNASLSRSETAKNPEKTILIFESVKPGRNASDNVTSLPMPGRHLGKNSIAFADGHARAVPTGGS